MFKKRIVSNRDLSVIFIVCMPQKNLIKSVSECFVMFFVISNDITGYCTV